MAYQVRDVMQGTAAHTHEWSVSCMRVRQQRARVTVCVYDRRLYMYTNTMLWWSHSPAVLRAVHKHF